jgi:hypothetical protein
MRNTLCTVLGNQAVHLLSDKAYDIRLNAATDLGNLAKKNVSLKSNEFEEWYTNIIYAINDELLSRGNPHGRKGGLMCLAAVAAGIGELLKPSMVSMLISLVVNSLDDDDSHVRYIACESLYNILSALSHSMMVENFQSLFDSLCKISADTDIQATCGSLDKVMRETVIRTSTTPQVFQTIESRILYPHAFVKQLSLGWLVSLREKDPGTFASRLCNILPPLFSLLSNSNTAPGGNDLYICGDAFITSLVSDIQNNGLVVSRDSFDRVLEVLIKYAKFQDTMKSRPRVIMFDLLRVIGLRHALDSSSAVFIAAAVVRVASDMPNDEELSKAVNRANESLLACEGFLRHIIRHSEYVNTLIDACQDSDPSVLITWLDKTLNMSPSAIKVDSKISPTRLFNIPGSELVLNGIIRIIHSQYNLSEYVHELINYLRKQPDTDVAVRASCDAISMVTGHDRTVQVLLELTRVITEVNANSKDPDILFSLCYLITETQSRMTELNASPKDDQEIILGTLRGTCIVGFIILCIVLSRFEDGLVALSSSQTIPVNHADRFSKVFDSESFSIYRGLLLEPEGNKFSKLLLALTMKLTQDSKAFKVILGRLQVISLHRSLSC